MDGRALSPWERRMLAEIETGLRAADARLDRELSTMRTRTPQRFGRVVRAAGRVPRTTLIVSVALSFVFLRASTYTHTAVDLALFSLVSVSAVVLVSARVLAGRRTRRGARTGQSAPLREGGR
ncbi:DUF3040 domain-containing protein [Streptomyces sp. SP17BM10]|uniref:DUF3040 domain-containing protein n=1 Tax=Streptomyces sp. SP17BM10 TaxID=3002530 RepID=UPI002E78125A|nr:DUF3040 domain-containing protein [Streptomyces sp. SP17BM10]MEE1782446.1 DUF3040 domain-containing protein [Streptomyces sp. SP17BM10]